jgi:predicted transposase YdaD
MSIKDLITPLEEIAMAEGEARGEARGEAKGEARGAACAILDALEARFGPIAPETAARLEAISELENLRSILRLAVTEPRLESFLAKLASY